MSLLPVRRDHTAPEHRGPGRWSPFREFDELHERMDRLFRTMWDNLDRSGNEPAWRPLADLSETDDAYIVEVDLPGVRKDDIAIDGYDRELVIRGGTRESDTGARLWRRNRRLGRFEHSVVLPSEVDTDSITASLDNGVLRITAPKVAAAAPRRVQITGA